MAYLVTVTPEVVLGADVLVRVLGPLRAGVLVLLVSDMLPVGIPPDLCVDGGNDDAGDSDADKNISRVPLISSSGSNAVLRPSFPSPMFQSCRQDLLETQLAPELARLSSVLRNVDTLAIKFVVLGSGKLLGALGAVVAAAGAGRGADGSAGKGLARCRAGDSSCGEHGEVYRGWWSGDGVQLVFRREV